MNTDQQQHVKSFNSDKRSKNRLRFSSSKQRAKRATADVYRSYKRRIGVTSAATREEQVHHQPEQHGGRSSRKKARKGSQIAGDKRGMKQSVFRSEQDDEEQDTKIDDVARDHLETTSVGSSSDEEDLEAIRSNFATELDVALDRNASQVFAAFHREIWPLVRSLPEILHHSEKIVDLLLMYLLSPEDSPSFKSSQLFAESEDKADDDFNARRRGRYIVNYATSDVLHLLAVLARDLRHEIHPFLHSKILPRIFNDLLNPPPLPPTPEPNEEASDPDEVPVSRPKPQQSLSLDVTIVEAAFRTLAYIFRYDAEPILSEQDNGDKTSNTASCLESMRKYYGITLAHRRDYVRRMAAETFAPLIRRIDSSSDRKRHLRRVLRAFVASSQSGVRSELSPSAKRLQEDAIDGISCLLFEVARGVKGKLHTRGGRVAIKCVLESLTGAGGNVDLALENVLFDVASSFIDRLCHFLDMSVTVETFHDMIDYTLRTFQPEEGNDEVIFAKIPWLLRLLCQMVSFRDGAIIRYDNSILEKLVFMLKKLLAETLFTSLGRDYQNVIVELLCAVWRLIPEDEEFADTVGSRLQKILSVSTEDTKIVGSDAKPSFRTILVENLLPHLPLEVAMRSIGSAIISTASALSEDHPDQARELVYAVVKSTKPSPADGFVEDTDETLSLDAAKLCSVSASHREKLLDMLLVDVDNLEFSEHECAYLVVSVESASFLSLTTESSISSKCCKKTLHWLVALLRRTRSLKEYKQYCAGRPDILILFSVGLTSFSRLSTIVLSGRVCGTKSTEKLASEVRPFAECHLVDNPSSLWAVKSVASFVSLLKTLGMTLCEAIDAIFEALVPNLRHPYHFLRLRTLEILDSLPQRPFVTDHADLDLTGDLDEEPSSYKGGSGSGHGATVSGMCDILATMFTIESTKPSVSDERRLISAISRVEVLGRSGRLPVSYAEAAASHMLGLFHVKFSPVWQAAVKALASLVIGHESSVWLCIHRSIEQVMDVKESSPDSTFKESTAAGHDLMRLRKYMAWEVSRGSDTSLFEDDLRSAQEQGRISRHLSTETEVVFESSWKVLEMAPSLITKHSKVLVPIFLRFMHHQYYADSVNDPDARELRLSDHVDSIAEASSRSANDRRVIQTRLVCILKAFSASKGPQQMFKNAVLRSIFTSLLSHHDSTVGLMSLSFVLGFKDEYLVPYADSIKKFFVKGKLREALMNFSSLIETGTVVREHRKRLNPIICRILFGRLSSKSHVKSSKESPAAMRIAVLSFLSTISDGEDDVYPFLYLMVRGYLPVNFRTTGLELQDSRYREGVVTQLEHVEPKDMAMIASGVHQGFLNMLQAVLSHLGHRIISFVPSLFSVLLCIARAHKVKDSVARVNELPNSDERSDDPNTDNTRSQNRETALRSLCCRRLSEIIGMFHTSVDLSPFAVVFWESLGRSVALLPEMVVGSESVPAVLTLLVSLSNSRAGPVFINDSAVEAVIRCIGPRSESAVVEAVLSFIENLLANFSNSETLNTGTDLIRRHMGTLLTQFKNRLDVTGFTSNAQGNKGKRPTWRRELDILCRVSQFMDAEVYDRVDSDCTLVIEPLCRLLVPYIHQRMASDTDRLNVLNILTRIIPNEAPEHSEEFYSVLSRMLAPNKGKPGIESREVRFSIAQVIFCLSKSWYHEAEPAAKFLVTLSRINSKRVNEIDIDVVLPALNSLGDATDSSIWLKLADVNGRSVPSILIPIINATYHFLFEDDGVITRSAFKALKSVVAVAACNLNLNDDDTPQQTVETWAKLLEGTIVNTARSGLMARNQAVRRFFVLILRETAFRCQKSSSPHLHGDLVQFVRDDQPDLDFFLNITHVQVHRRARALQRLRKALISPNNEAGSPNYIRPQSLSNILLPLAIHPVYECKSKAEEGLVIEAVATVGAIARKLSWSKYSSTLGTTLNQLQRNADQERYLISMLCAIIDGFHFDVEMAESDVDASDSAVFKAVENRICPKVEALLVKSDKDKGKTLRPSVLLALQKLYQKFPDDMFRSKLPRLLAVVCDILKSRDSDAREVARTTLAKMVCSMDLIYLPDVVRELAVTLNEGYKLHVRAAVVHTILLEISVSGGSDLTDGSYRGIDAAVPGLVDLIQQDLFGGAQEWKDARDSHVRYVKEAGGSKSLNALELLSTMITFKPLVTEPADETQIPPPVQILLSPFLERLQDQAVSMTTIKRIRECLTRIVSGLSRNKSVRIEDLLIFVHSTLSPFVEQLDRKTDGDGHSDTEDGESLKPITVSGRNVLREGQLSGSAPASNVSTWRPSTLNAPGTQKAAIAARRTEEKRLAKVHDGRSAPKLTGSNRLRVSAVASLNDPTTVSAVDFGIQLLYFSLKKVNEMKQKEIKHMLDPFIPLLASCVCYSSEVSLVLLALKTLGLFVRQDLPSFSQWSDSLASKVLMLLTSSGSSSNQNQEVLQACFKMLSFLLRLSTDEEESSIPLTDDQMQVLLSFLRSSIADDEQHNPAFTLLKSIMARRYVNAELYDLMETLLEQSVRSPKTSLRQQSSSVFVNYLTQYPLSPQRVEQHLKQIVLNLNYEYADGRLSAIHMLSTIIERVPLSVIEKHSQLFFLPLTLQLVNDDSKECREAVAKCLSVLIKKLSADSLQSVGDYIFRWLVSEGELRRTAFQLCGIVVESRPDLLKRRGLFETILTAAQDTLKKSSAEWEIGYFALIFVEKSMVLFRDVLVDRTSLWISIAQSLSSDHPWLRLVSSRILSAFLATLSLETLTFTKSSSKKATFLVEKRGSLYQLARGYCYQLSLDDNQQSEEIVALAAKSLTWLVQAMNQHPELCYDTDQHSESEELDSEAGYDSKEKRGERDPVLWVMTRLSNIARKSGTKRRQSIYKCFAAFATLCMPITQKYLSILLEPLNRSEVQGRTQLEEPSKLGDGKTSWRTSQPSAESSGLAEELQLARDVIHMLEENSTDHDAFVQALGTVKRKAQERKEQRKVEAQTLAVRDPQLAAKRRVEKHEKDKQRKKRRVQEQRFNRGAGRQAKRRHNFD